MSSSEVLELIKAKEAKWADLRFTDTRGKEQHVSTGWKQGYERDPRSLAKRGD